LRNWGFECRCELCSLSGEELRKDEELRKELSHQEDMFFYYLGRGRAACALEIFAEEVLEVMEENRDKFSNQMSHAYGKCAFAAAEMGAKEEEEEF